jgi:hypothetical protein
MRRLLPESVPSGACKFCCTFSLLIVAAYSESPSTALFTPTVQCVQLHRQGAGNCQRCLDGVVAADPVPGREVPVSGAAWLFVPVTLHRILFCGLCSLNITMEIDNIFVDQVRAQYGNCTVQTHDNTSPLVHGFACTFPPPD